MSDSVKYKMDNNEYYKNLALLLKQFKNRPSHLAKFLFENYALKDEFLKKISESGIIEELVDKKTPLFLDINQMNDYYNSLIDDVKIMEHGKTKKEIENEFNTKLNYLIEHEKFEEAARLRDYMKRNKIKRFK